jgi:cytochrome c oxidase cbb3-type subunit 3
VQADFKTAAIPATSMECDPATPVGMAQDAYRFNPSTVMATMKSEKHTWHPGLGGLFVCALGLALSTFPVSRSAGAAKESAPPAKSTEQGLAKQGEDVFNLQCVSCHQPGAKGQVGFAPSIRNRDFLAIASDDFIRRTIREGRPGTAMVARPDLKNEDVTALIAYLRSDRILLPLHISVNPELKFAGSREAGALKFAIYCSVCHGPYGDGYSAGVPGTGIGLPGFLNVASDDYILQTLKRGRIGTPMQPFIGARGLANLTESDAHDIIAHLRYLGSTYEERLKNMPVGPGNPKAGEIHFNVNCSACHQTGGLGKVGFAPAIRNRDFLALASDNFIKQTVQNGREGTGMVPRPDLPPQTVNDIISYLRALPVANKVAYNVNPALELRGDATQGAELFANYCASCHGPQGQGYVIGVPGPAIGLPGFLKVASDDYIFQTVKHGRVGTPMKSFLGSQGLANLTESDVKDVIAHLRVLEKTKPAAPAAGASSFE